MAELGKQNTLPYLCEWVLSRIRVTPLANTQLVDISFTAADPDFAARAVNAHIEGYVAENLERLSAEVQGTLIWLGSELESQRKLVEQAERALADYRDSQDALSLGADDMVSGRLIQLNAAVTHLETIRLQKESLYNRRLRGSRVTAARGLVQLSPSLRHNGGYYDLTNGR